MVQSVAVFSRNVNNGFRQIKEDINSLRMKSSFIAEKIKELQLIESGLKTDVRIVKELAQKSAAAKRAKKPTKKTVLRTLKEEFTPKPQQASTNVKTELQFYDVKARKRFSTRDYKETVKNQTLFAVAQSPYGSNDCYRILKKV